MSGVVERKSADGSETFIFFYGSGTIFSNFTEAPFEIDDVTFNCPEQYFQYKKADIFGDQLSMQAILESKKPGKQKALGRKVQNFDKDKWTAMSVQVMREALLAKFGQNQELRQRLLETGDKTLVEASPGDRIWGIGRGMNSPEAIDRSQWKGENRLGVILMEVRQELKKK